MSEFKIEIINDIRISNHPNADRLEIASIADYKCVVAKGDFKTGDSAIYIPEGSILPEDLMKKLGLVGKLSGPRKNRVKAVKLRGVLSQGIACKLDILSKEDHEALMSLTFQKKDNSEELRKALGIEKYVPEIPVHLSGQVWNAGKERTVDYDIENIKKYPHMFVDGEPVVMTEKCHGTFAMFGYMPLSLEHPEQGRVVVSSKGHASNGLALKKPQTPAPQTLKQKLFERFWKLEYKLHTILLHAYCFITNSEFPEETLNRFYRGRMKKYQNRGVNENNTYWNTYNKANPFRNVCYAFSPEDLGKPIFILGEIFGGGIQDMSYGYTSPEFRVFDIKVGDQYLNDDEVDKACALLDLTRVPIVYRGPFSKKAVEEYTSGKETVSGSSKHIREGVVIRPVVERTNSKIGRVQLKSVSEDYLLRKGGTEYN